MANTNIEKLMELKQLYDTGVLTKEEMETEKTKILGTAENEPQDDSVSENCQSLNYKASFFQKNKKIIVGTSIIIAIAVLLSFLFFKKQLSTSTKVYDSSQPVNNLLIANETEQDSIYLVKSLSDDLQHIFCIKIEGKKVTGYAKFAGYNPYASLDGTIDKDKWLILNRTEGKETDRFEGKLDSDGFSGALFPIDGNSSVPWVAKRMTKDQVDELENTVKDMLVRTSVSAYESNQEAEVFSFVGAIQGSENRYSFKMFLDIYHNGNVEGCYFVTNGENDDVVLRGHVNDWSDKNVGEIVLYEYNQKNNEKTGYYFQGQLFVEYSEQGRVVGYSMEGRYKNSNINWPFEAQSE